MAKQELTGRTQEQLREIRTDWEERHPDVPFEEQYCLSRIAMQPDDYDGPQRYCVNQETYETPNGKFRCPSHGGDRDDYGDYSENLGDTDTAAMKHGMHATVENLKKDFDEKDSALYHWITDSYPEAYDIDVDADPAAKYDLHRLAAEIVRAERGRGFLLEEGEVVEQEVRNEEGQVIIDDEGEIVTEKSEHYLAGMMDRQDRKITKLEKELGITRKEQRKHQNEENAAEALKTFAELGSAFLQRDDKEYDPDDKPWDND
jgi:hypothetical protein